MKNFDDLTQRSWQTVLSNCKNNKDVFCHRRKIDCRLIMNDNCKETVLCYNLSDIIIIDDNFIFAILWLW